MAYGDLWLLAGPSARDARLPAWTAADRPIENTNAMLWYVSGIHHITRPEAWPVTPVETVSFWLKPFGFFDRNPALDVPPTHPEYVLLGLDATPSCNSRTSLA